MIFNVRLALRFFRFSILAASTVLLASCATAPTSVSDGYLTDIVYRPQGASIIRQDIYHVIGPAETAYRISRMYDVSLDSVLKANNIKDPRELKIGQKLVIPNAAPLRPVIPVFKSSKWRYIVVHHSVTDSGDARYLDLIHRRRGFDRGLGYHFVIDNGTDDRLDGQIEASPRWIKQMDGAHCNIGGMNECGIGICLVGDFTNERPSAKQMDALVLLVNTLRRYYRIPLSRIIRHKDVPGKNTACPGDSFPWKEFKERLKRGK